MPKIVKEYNTHFKDVDLLDIFTFYRTSFKIYKLYMAILLILLNICINYDWVTYQRDCHRFKEKKL